MSDEHSIDLESAQETIPVVPYRGGRALLIDSLHIARPRRILPTLFLVNIDERTIKGSLESVIEEATNYVDYILIVTSYSQHALPYSLRKCVSESNRLSCFRYRTKKGAALEHTILRKMASNTVKELIKMEGETDDQT